jgi:hypothetical protein
MTDPYLNLIFHSMRAKCENYSLRIRFFIWNIFHFNAYLIKYSCFHILSTYMVTSAADYFVSCWLWSTLRWIRKLHLARLHIFFMSTASSSACQLHPSVLLLLVWIYCFKVNDWTCILLTVAHIQKCLKWKLYFIMSCSLFSDTVAGLWLYSAK